MNKISLHKNITLLFVFCVVLFSASRAFATQINTEDLQSEQQTETSFLIEETVKLSFNSFLNVNEIRLEKPGFFIYRPSNNFSVLDFKKAIRKISSKKKIPKSAFISGNETDLPPPVGLKKYF